MQMKGLEEKFAAGEARREEAYAKELRKQKEVWGASEKAKREQWLADKTKEIKEATVRGLEPDIARLVGRHKEETVKLSESLREDHRRELASERTRAQHELARFQEGAIAERHAVQEREREVCAQRLHEMTLHFEEQLRVQRSRQASAAQSELEERDDAVSGAPAEPQQPHSTRARALTPRSPLANAATPEAAPPPLVPPQAVARAVPPIRVARPP